MGQVKYARQRDRARLLRHAVELARPRPPRAQSRHLRQDADGPHRTRGGTGGRGDFPRIRSGGIRYRRDRSGGRRIPGKGTLTASARYTGVMRNRGAGVFILALATRLIHAGAAADMARQIAQNGLDPEDCYRVRDLTLTKEDVRLYFSEGHIIFGKPAGDAPISAVFVTSVQGGDAEILTLPPSKSERQSRASYTGSPNLSEHFKVAVLLFTDETYRDLVAQIRDNSSKKKSPEMGLTLAPEWSAVTRNLAASFESRLVLDLLSGPRASRAFFFAAIGGNQLGNFDVIYDARAREQITIGKVGYRDTRAFFDVWTTFESRSVRSGTRPQPEREFDLSDFRIDAIVTPPDLRLAAVTRVKVKPASGSARVVAFDLSRQMRVTSASVDGQSAEVFETESMRSNLIRDRGNDLFLLIPAQALTPGREDEFEFHPEGAGIADAGNKVYAVGSRANCYPNQGLQFAKFDLTFRYPKELDLVSTGELVSDAEEGELRVTRRRASAPIRIAGFNLGMYDRTKIVRGGETVALCANRNLERARAPQPIHNYDVPPPP